MILGIASEITNLSGIITTEKTLTGKISVSVRDVPYYETENVFGGTTVYIGKELVNNGN